MWDTTGELPKREFIALNAYIRKKENHKINNLAPKLRTLIEKGGATK